MSHRRTRRTILWGLGLCGLALLAACAPEPTDAASPGATAHIPRTSATPDPTASASPSATAAALPTDCRAILSDAVLAQLADLPLNDPAFGRPTGVQSDGSLVCLWGSPAADTTHLDTTISRMSRGPALDLMNQLRQGEAYTCYTPDRGTRCEKTWVNAQYPVTDGRTLFWRDDVLIDTRYSNLAPVGYTDAIVAHVFG